MPATVQLVEKNGAGGDATDKTSGTIRFKKADNATVDFANPLSVPPSGTDWSFEKWLRLNVTGAPDGQITNVRAYSDGSNGLGTGRTVYAKAEADYAQPQQASGSSGYSDLFGYTSGSPLSLGSGPFTGTGERGSHLVLIAGIADTASNGVSTEGLNVAWDEI